MQEQEQTPNVVSTEAPPQVELDPVKLQEIRAKLERAQNLPAGIVAGLAAALVGAVAWAAVTVATHYSWEGLCMPALRSNQSLLVRGHVWQMRHTPSLANDVDYAA